MKHTKTETKTEIKIIQPDESSAESVLTLTGDEARVFTDALMNPPAPNGGLMAAAQAYIFPSMWASPNQDPVNLPPPDVGEEDDEIAPSTGDMQRIESQLYSKIWQACDKELWCCIDRRDVGPNGVMLSADEQKVLAILIEKSPDKQWLKLAARKASAGLPLVERDEYDEERSTWPKILRDVIDKAEAIMYADTENGQSGLFAGGIVREHIAHIDAVDRQVDAPIVRGPIDIRIGGNLYRNPG